MTNACMTTTTIHLVIASDFSLDEHVQWRDAVLDVQAKKKMKALAMTTARLRASAWMVLRSLRAERVGYRTNAALVELGLSITSEFDNGGSTAGTSVHQTMLEHTMKTERKQVADNFVENKCRIRATCVQKFVQKRQATFGSPHTLTTHLKALLWTPAATTKVCPRAVLLW